MGDNKISEARLPALPVGPGATQEWHDELVREAYSRGLADGLRADRAPMAADHLQGEAVPVAVAAGISEFGVLECNLLPGGLEQLQATGGDAKLYLHPQPAELNEVSGNSGELRADAERYRWLRGDGLAYIKFEGLTTETCDVGLDYAISAAMEKSNEHQDQ